MGQGSRHRCGCLKAASGEETPACVTVLALAEALLGLDGFKVLDVVESATGELTVTVESTVEMVGCPHCGCGLRPRIGCRSRTGIWSVSAARCGWCG